MAAPDDGKLLEQLGRGKRPESLGLNRNTEGFVELRGLRVEKPKPKGRFWAGGAGFDYVPGKPTFRGLTIRGVDLSFAVLEDTIWEECCFQNVRFEGLRGRGIIFATSNLDSVAFLKAGLQAALWGQDRFDGPVVSNVEFTECDLRYSAYAHSVFRNCRWTNCNLKGVNFGGARFEDCSFEGLLDDVMFHGRYRDPDPSIANLRNPMRNVDFSKADLRGVSFTSGVDLTSCAFPADGYLRIPRPEIVYRKALERVKGTWPEGKAKDRAAYYLEGMSAHFPEEQPFTIERIGDFDDWPGAPDVGHAVLEELKAAIRPLT